MKRDIITKYRQAKLRVLYNKFMEERYPKEEGLIYDAVWEGGLFFSRLSGWRLNMESFRKSKAVQRQLEASRKNFSKGMNHD